MKLNNIIIVGAGRLGGTIARKLNKESNVLIIDKDKAKLAKLHDYSGFLENGDATDLALLEKCGVKTADKVIAVTDDDNVNIFIADVCTKIYNVANTTIKLKDSRKRKLVDESVKCICPFDLSLDYFEQSDKKEEA